MTVYRVLMRGPNQFIVQTRGFMGLWRTTNDFSNNLRLPGNKRVWVPIEYARQDAARSAIIAVEVRVQEALRNDYPKVVDEGFVANDGSWVNASDVQGW